MTITTSRFTLAPAFDQLPMLYAPTSDGQLPEREFTRPAPSADTWGVWDEATKLATLFWERAAQDPRITEATRTIAQGNRQIIA